MSTNRNLVIVRAGEKSLHRRWLEGARNWDLVVSWYGDAPYEPVADEAVVRIKGGIGDGLFKTFEALPHLLERYDRFWLPDDDIETDCETINRVFELTEEHGLAVAQPSLTHDSYFTHAHTLRSRSFHLRYTTFVEIMAPCLTRDRLKAVLPLFDDNPSLFGLDLIWARLDDDNRRRAAIIDAVSVRHTRPVGYFGSRSDKDKADPFDMLRRIGAMYGLDPFKREFYCYGGVARPGGFELGRRATMSLMYLDNVLLSRDYLQEKARKAMRREFRLPPATLTRLRRVSGEADCS